MSATRIFPGRGLERAGISPEIGTALELGQSAVEAQDRFKFRRSGHKSNLYRLLNSSNLTAYLDQGDVISVCVVPILRRDSGGAIRFTSTPGEPQITIWTTGIPTLMMREALLKQDSPNEAELLANNSGPNIPISTYHRDFVINHLMMYFQRTTGQEDQEMNRRFAETVTDPSISVLRFPFPK